MGYWLIISGRGHPEDFKAVHRYDLDDWWVVRNRDYWFKTSLEKILEDLRCPYTQENPSEDEFVEIDESKLVEVLCCTTSK